MSTELYELTLEGVHNLQAVENVMHFEGDNLTANDTYTNGGDLLTSFIAAVLPSWLGCLPPSYQATRITARRAITKPSVVRHTQFGVGVQLGSLGTEATSYNLCPCVFLIPPLGTKSGGKIFMPCVPEGQIIGNTYQTSYTTAIGVLMSIMLTNFGTGSITWISAILSRKHNTFSQTSNWRLSPVIGFQGKRRKAVGG